MSEITYNQTPTTLNSFKSLDIWVDSSYVESVTESSSRVSAHDDNSGNSNNFAQPTSTKQPVYNSGSINGKNAILYATGASLYSLLGPTSINGGAGYQEVTLFQVLKPTSGNKTRSYTLSKDGSGSNPGDASIIYSNSASSGKMLFADQVNGIIIESEINIDDSAPHIVCLTYGQNSGYKIYVDGVLQDSRAVVGNTVWQNSTAVEIGSVLNAGISFFGEIGETLVYGEVVSDLDRHLLHRYLANKWGAKYDVDLITYGKEFHINAYDLSAGSVSNWIDRTGNYSITQTTGTQQPTCNLTGLNGRPTVVFDGTDDEMDTDFDLDIDTNPNLTIHIVFQFNSGDSGVFGNDDGAWDRFLLMNFSAFSGDVVLSYQDSTSQQIRISQVATGVYLATIKFTASDAELMFNGLSKRDKALVSVGASTLTMAIGNIASGETYNLDGSISEMVIYNRILNQEEIVHNEKILAGRWGLTEYLGFDKSDLQVLIEFEDADTVDTSASSITKVFDKSGNRNHFTQGTSTNQPVYDSVEGLATFDGINDFLTATTPTVIDIYQADYEIFIVFKSSDTTNVQFLVGSSALTEEFEAHLNGAGQGLRFIPTATKYCDIGATGDYCDGDLHIVQCRVDANIGSVTVDDVVSIDTETPCRSTSNNDIIMGLRGNSTLPLNGSIACFAITNRILTDETRTAIVNYLKIKSGITQYPFLVENAPILWLDAADASTVTLNGSNVSQWDDKSGNNNHALQGISTAQPDYTGTISDKNVINFDGSSDYMDLTNRTSNAGDTTIFIVAYNDIAFTGEDTAQILFTVDTNVGTEPYGDIRFGTATALISGETINLVSIDSGTFNGVVSSTLDIPIGAHVHTFRLSETTTTLKRDGNTLFTQEAYEGLDSSGSDLQNFRRIGKNRDAFTNYFNGKICEILVYDYALSDDEVSLIDSYLKNKWRI